jgi:F-box/leucine-rich repeat protein 2/20
MSTTNDIDDCDETLFQFDPFDSHQPLLVPSSPQLTFTFGMAPSRNSVSAQPASLPSDLDNRAPPIDVMNAKGKARTMPMPIRQSTIVHDLFDISPQKLSSPMSYDSSSSVMICSPSSSNFSSDSNCLLRRHCSFLTENREQSHSLDSVSGSCTGKGKEKALFPMLPPLTFSNIDLDYYDQLNSLPPGPYDDGTSPTINGHGFPHSSAIPVTDIRISSPHSSETGVSLSNPPVSRCQSLSNLSHQLEAFPPSVGSPSTAVASTFETPGASRQLLEVFDQKNVKGSVATTHASLSLDLQLIPSELDDHLPAWYTAAKTLDAKSSSYPCDLFRSKGRSRSSPYPLSVLDIIPYTSTDVFQPLPLVIRNFFDLVLPKELRLHILRALVDLHEDDHQRSILERRFTVAKATSSRGRWIGRDKGIRELFKFSRVCL